MNETRVFAVTELNLFIKQLIDNEPTLSYVFVRGEISNYKMYPSGHHYFTLKDQESTLRCVMFKREASRLHFLPKNGMKVIVFGRVSVYPRDGGYQLYCSELAAEGIGDLHVAFERLKGKLYKQGLFDESHKKQLPSYPQQIAIITSPAGAAVRDIIRILGARYPLAKIIILPVRVQGIEAPSEICAAISYAEKNNIADVIITGRGGGSIEDLWAFNNENVARAIYKCKIPVISAVGHEPDVTISDFVADVRASTPSNAAELAVPERSELYENIRNCEIRMLRAVKRRIDIYRKELDGYVSSRALRSRKGYINDKRLQLDNLLSKLYACAISNVAVRRKDLVQLSAALDAMSPLKVLSRGYSVAVNKSGELIKSVNDVTIGEQVNLRLSDGKMSCLVEGRESSGRKGKEL